MPLIKAGVDVDDLNSFIDIAITDDNEINPIVSVSRNTINNRRISRTTHSRRSSIDSTSWRAARGTTPSCGGESFSQHSDDVSDCLEQLSLAASSRHSGRSSRQHSISSSCVSEKQATITKSATSIMSENKNMNNNPHDENSSAATSKDGNGDVVYPLRHSVENYDDYDNEEERVEQLEQKIAKISFELAEAQAQVDWYKMKYRHLHVEFADLQEFCQALQDENMELRSENEQLRKGLRVAPKTRRSSWFENAKLMSLGQPRSIPIYGSKSTNATTRSGADTTSDDGDDWDDDTLTTNFCESSRSFFGDSASNKGGTCGAKLNRKDGQPEDKPENIVFGVKGPLLGLE